MTSKNIEIQDFHRSHADLWEDYVDRHPGGTFFHGLGWKRAVERSFGHYPRYLVAVDGRRLVGILPIFEINSLLTGRFFVSVPYATYGGILADDGSIAEALLDRASQIAQMAGAKSIELRSIDAVIGSAPIRRSHAMFRKALPQSRDEVSASFPRKARAAVRQARRRYCLSVEFDRSLLEVVWRLYARSMRRLGSPN